MLEYRCDGVAACVRRNKNWRSRHLHVIESVVAVGLGDILWTCGNVLRYLLAPIFELAECRVSNVKRCMQLFKYRSVRYWSKEIDGTLPTGRKK